MTSKSQLKRHIAQGKPGARAEELWFKYAVDIDDGWIEKDSFLAALAEYGQEVRRRDAGVCGAISDRSDKHDYSDYANPKEARRICRKENDMTWDEFEKMLVENGWPKDEAHAERLAQEHGDAGDCDGDLSYD